MKKQLSSRFVSLAAAFLLAVALSSIAVAATYVTNTTIGNTPSGSGATGWTFTARSDTNQGESVCIEVHPVGDPGNYVNVRCDYTSGTNPSNWTCTVFPGGVPAAFRNTTVEYQFLVSNSNSSNCNGNRHAFTGFNWRFRTDPAGNPAPLAVTLSDFRAMGIESGVMVEWETVSETDMLGFNLLRAESAKGTPERINPELIPTTGGSTGASYDYEDATAESGTLFFYWLDAVETTGATERFGPVSARAGVPTAVTLGSAGAAPAPTMPLLALAGMAALGAIALLRRRA